MSTSGPPGNGPALTEYNLNFTFLVIYSVLLNTYTFQTKNKSVVEHFISRYVGEQFEKQSGAFLMVKLKMSIEQWSKRNSISIVFSPIISRL
jgi:hypothetical protein